MIFRTILLPVTLTMTMFAACVTVDETNRRQFIVVPESQMNQMGITAYDDIKKQEKISTDQKLTAEIVKIGQRIAQASGKNYDWAFTLFDNKEPNAFCLPGGKVGVYTGIIPITATNAGLAAVIAHEVAHATAKHGAERVSQQLALTGVMIGADVALNDPKYKQMIMAGLGLGAQFGVLLPYSRKQESEADKIGLLYMAKAGYDPREAVELWKRMAQLGDTPPEFLSTHPNPLSRAEAIQSWLAEAMPVYEKSQKQPTTKI